MSQRGQGHLKGVNNQHSTCSLAGCSNQSSPGKIQSNNNGLVIKITSSPRFPSDHSRCKGSPKCLWVEDTSSEQQHQHGNNVRLCKMMNTMMMIMLHILQQRRWYVSMGFHSFWEIIWLLIWFWGRKLRNMEFVESLRHSVLHQVNRTFPKMSS